MWALSGNPWRHSARGPPGGPRLKVGELDAVDSDNPLSHGRRVVSAPDRFAGARRVGSGTRGARCDVLRGEGRGGRPLRVTFFGVRGSCPCSGGQYVRYGGNTACVAVEVGDEPPIVLDLGTGLRPLGHASRQRYGREHARSR